MSYHKPDQLPHDEGGKSPWHVVLGPLGWKNAATSSIVQEQLGPRYHQISLARRIRENCRICQSLLSNEHIEHFHDLMFQLWYNWTIGWEEWCVFALPDSKHCCSLQLAPRRSLRSFKMDQDGSSCRTGLLRERIPTRKSHPAPRPPRLQVGQVELVENDLGKLQVVALKTDGEVKIE